MRPSHIEPFNSPPGDRDRRLPWSQDAQPTQQSTTNRRSRFESDLQTVAPQDMAINPTDSWIEISSHTSSSSLYAARENEIITTGLSLRRNAERRSRRSISSASPRETTTTRSTSATGSSQDEYEESESESDQVMSSSNEDVSNHDEEDDNSTALGVGTTERNIFTPQPNAFSHPPNTNSVPLTDTYFPSHPSSVGAQRLPSNRMPSISRPPIRERATNSFPQSDHDAALRASLTTLLSCAAAVRTEPKERQAETQTRRSTQPTVLRLIPESELNAPTRSQKATTKRRSRESSKDRQAKKMRAIKSQPQEDLVSPTMMTWFISAGVVLVFSAISFSAGYAWGKEVGRIEGEMGVSASCGQEAMRSSGGLRKLRLSAGRT